jgi:hypothetical protein
VHVVKLSFFASTASYGWEKILLSHFLYLTQPLGFTLFWVVYAYFAGASLNKK